MKGKHAVHLSRGFWDGIWSGMSIEVTYMKIGKGSPGVLGQATNSRSVTLRSNSYHLRSEVLTELKSLRNRVKGEKQA